MKGFCHLDTHHKSHSSFTYRFNGPHFTLNFITRCILTEPFHKWYMFIVDSVKIGTNPWCQSGFKYWCTCGVVYVCFQLNKVKNNFFLSCRSFKNLFFLKTLKCIMFHSQINYDSAYCFIFQTWDVFWNTEANRNIRVAGIDTERLRL